MPCLVCGDIKTVRSHIVPKAVAEKIRGSDRNITVFEAGAPRVRSSNAGNFDSGILCSLHENVTGELDRYGVNFIRMVRAGRNRAQSDSFMVRNPDPEKLHRFALSIVWRAAVSRHGGVGDVPLDQKFSDFESVIFHGAPATTALLVSCGYLRHESVEVLVATMPNFGEFQGNGVWRFNLIGCYFMLFVDPSKLPLILAPCRADLHNPVKLLVHDEEQALDWAPFERIMKTIGKSGRP